MISSVMIGLEIVLSLPLGDTLKTLVLDHKDRRRAVAFCTVLVALEIIGIDEFLSVIVMIDEAQIADEDVSEGFLRAMAEFHRTRLG